MRVGAPGIWDKTALSWQAEGSEIVSGEKVGPPSRPLRVGSAPPPAIYSSVDSFISSIDINGKEENKNVLKRNINLKAKIDAQGRNIRMK